MDVVAFVVNIVLSSKESEDDPKKRYTGAREIEEFAKRTDRCQ